MRFFSILNKATRFAVVGLILVCLSGCAPKYQDLKAFLQAHDHEITTSQYRIEPPDVIAIESPNVPEVHGEMQRIGGDGKITLKLLGPVKVSSLTPRETAAKLEKLLARYYVSPTVNVRVVQHASKKIYVNGQVSRPGPIPYTGRDTVLNVLAEAQPTFIAWCSQVKIIRPSAQPDERKELVIDIDKIMKSGDLKENYLLQPGDLVYVPPTPLGWIGLRVRELLFPFTPIGQAYTTPARFMAATDYYHDRKMMMIGIIRPVLEVDGS